MNQQKTVYYRQGISEAKSGKLQPAYFIYGEETFLIDELIDKITKKFWAKRKRK